ncbi:MAG: hypothetical protein ACREI8_00055 [Myxococcota bacterium]
MASATFHTETTPAREMRVRFTTRAGLQAGIDRAQREPWVAAWRVDRFRRELVLELAGGFGVRPPLRVIDSAGTRPN